MSSRPRSSSSSASLSRSRSCSLENSSTYFAEYGRKCGWRRQRKKKADNLEVGLCYDGVMSINVQVEVAFEDPDTGNIIRETVEVWKKEETKLADIQYF